ncbi:WecB/TagA/CpsF family glycosyltransferase [Photobacterium profundum]|uniref:Hypothetical teichoic acid biosynthesis protein A n=1 Tax=Photobacterium profundum (strain SS9) TaxID=298386 RepID=Q6LNS1_PHOPR|nr:WecB/TagA/CpsF family glycosyltransferase [Photobacterium profundum]CAG21055.1 hypothetical teichoic acid biosynthesis protein A [Photobacterium profundum SS9]
MVRSIRNHDLDSKVKGSIESLNHALESDEKLFISFVNPFSYQIISSDQNIINSVDVFYSDGILLTKLHNFFYKKKLERMSFDYSSIADNVLTYIQDKEMNLAIIGSKYEELEVFITTLEKRYPKLRVVYYRDGYFSESEYESIASKVEELDADYILLGLGSPKQEIFGSFLKNRLLTNVKIFTCGGFIYQTSVKDDYYYPLVKKFNLMWLQRFLLHDYVRKRLIKDYPKFILSYILGFIPRG